MSGNVPDELDDVCQVVLVPGVVLARVGLEQVVTCRHLEGHARRRPNVSRGSVASTKENLQTSILASLDIFCEMMILKKKYHNLAKSVTK